MENSSTEPLKQGDSYKGFTVTKSMPIPELQCHLTEFVHNQSGARCMHIGNEDPENLFCLSFRTLPESSNGICHILEHTVLCGSKKFPVKDPFFSMNRRSLNTFMNALTGADFTCYPAASQVEQDFYNLLDVYLDAVFHPLLNKLSFWQEGCRLEFTTPDDPTSELQYKGIVFNEMKGSLSSPMTRLIEAINAELFPNTPYGYNSGGDPSEIPNLTYEELLAFHETYYHPSKCLFFFSGNLPITKHLDFLETNLLHKVHKQPPLPEIPTQPRFSKPVYKELSYPFSAEDNADDKSLIALSWITCPILDQISVLALSVIDIVLMDTDASLLKIELLRSGLCKQAQSMLESEVSEIPYAIILNGCKSSDADALEAIIFNTLRKLSREGIPQKLIDNALHQLELAKSEITGDSAPFGLSLFSRAALISQHGGNAEDGLRIHSLFEELRNRFSQSPHFLSELINRYFLTNSHFVRICMNPSSELTGQELQKEEEKLKIIRQGFTKEDEQITIERSQSLSEFQEQAEENGIDCLPKISLEDVPKKARALELSHLSLGSLEVFCHHTFTNNITYADLIFPIPDTKEEDLWLVRLFTLILSQIGSGLRSYEDTLGYIQENTGGVSAFLSLYHQVSDPHAITPTVHIKGKALYDKAPKLFSLLFDMATSPNVSNQARIKEIILKHYSNMQSSFNNNALKYATNLAGSAFDTTGRFYAACYGLEYFNKIKNLALNIDNKIDWLLKELERIQKHLLCTSGAHLVLTCDKTELSKYLEDGFQGLVDLPKEAFTPWKGDFSPLSFGHQGRIIDSPVAFTCKICETIPYSHPDSPLISLAANLFDNITLHKRVREQGGAYGAGSSSNPMSGIFSLYSYRDPNIFSTIQAFEEAVHTVIAGEFDLSHLEEAKLEMIQQFDSPISPGSRGFVAYAWWKEGKTVDRRQAFRDAILQASKEDIMKAVETHLLPFFNKGIIASFGGKELLKRENIRLQEANLPTLHIEAP